MYDFKGKIALVTGGGRGIGLSCVQELFRNGIHAVTIIDVNFDESKNSLRTLIEEYGDDRVAVIQTDVTKHEEFEAAFKETIKRWKTIDILINNAGILNDANWEKEIDINCVSVVRGTLLGFRYMGKDKGGNGGIIVNMASTLGLQPLTSCPIYVASKHFVVGFDRSLGTSYHYDRTGIKILTMCPGYTTTDIVENVDTKAITSLASDIGQLLANDFSVLPRQPPDHVAKNVINLIKDGSNGSIRVVEANEPAYEIELPDRKNLRKN